MRIIPDNTYRNPYLMTVLILVVILVGTVITVAAPMLTPTINSKSALTPTYTALQLAGKDVYQKEGCVSCHTQTVRPLQSEVTRYVYSRGSTTKPYDEVVSQLHESQYDRPFLWGSRRTGPDLARVGLWYNYNGAEDLLTEMLTMPSDFFPTSNMPKYAFLSNKKLNPAQVRKNMKANRFKFTEAEITGLTQKTEMDAIVAYLLTLGRTTAGDSTQ